MGLDVYLQKRVPENMHWQQVERDADEATNKIWNEEMAKLGKSKYEELTGAEKDAISAKTRAYYESVGLNEYGEAKEQYHLDLEHPDARYPDHTFKIGYFRSSYNDGGFNNVMRAILGEEMDLYYIFPDQENVDWEGALVRAKEMLALFDEKTSKNGCLGVLHLQSRWDHFSGNTYPASKGDAMGVYEEEAARHTSMFGAYQSAKGHFWLREPIPVVAIIVGPDKSYYVIYKKDNEDHAWYRQALEIVISTIEFVLDQPDRQMYQFLWSG